MMSEREEAGLVKLFRCAVPCISPVCIVETEREVIADSFYFATYLECRLKSASEMWRKKVTLNIMRLTHCYGQLLL